MYKKSTVHVYLYTILWQGPTSKNMALSLYFVNFVIDYLSYQVSTADSFPYPYI